MDIYVNSQSCGGDGSREKPFSCVCEARDFIRNSADGDFTVHIAKGRYFINETIRFTSEDKAALYIAEEGAAFDGGVVIDESLISKTSDEAVLSRIIEEAARDKIMEIDLSGFDFPLAEYGTRGFRRMYTPSQNELYINGEPQSVSCYPKDVFYPLGKIADSGSFVLTQLDFSCRKPVIGYTDERCDLWQSAKDAYVHGFLGAGYADDTIKIENIDTEKREITLKTPAIMGVSENHEHRWKIINLLEELSEDGEYFVDREAKKIYFCPPCDMNGAFVQVSVLETPMLSFVGASNITFSGITFENARGTGVYIGEGENVTIENCVFRNLGLLAVQIGQGTTDLPEGKHNGEGTYAEGYSATPCHERVGDWMGYLYVHSAWDGNAGFNHTISGCDIYNTGSGGILLGGGNRRKLIPAGNKVYNCSLHEVNRLDKTYKGAINVWGMGNTISHCDMYDLDGSAVYLYGNDHVIEYTKMHNALRTVSDAGVIYMGRNPSEVGNVFRHNFIYNIKNPHSYDRYGFAAIYFDDGAIFNEVYGNYFYDVVQRGPFFFSTIHWNGGGGTSVANNIAIDCFPGFDPNTYDNSYKLMHENKLHMSRVADKNPDSDLGVDVTDDAWRRKYPYLYDTYMNDFIQETRYYNNFAFAGQYQNFVDENPSNLNFKLRKKSYCHHKYARVHDCIKGYDGDCVQFKEPVFEKIGLVK